MTAEDIAYVISHIGQFGGDNRAGDRADAPPDQRAPQPRGKVVGLTLRVGRAVYGTVEILRDIVESGAAACCSSDGPASARRPCCARSRACSRMTSKARCRGGHSNEIAGDGDIPTLGSGRARRMQVPTPSLQHAVMIEAVENHMPEVVVIDEIGTEQEAGAARTIAERGVQLIATAHGNHASRTSC